jgi:hypothetical protein
MKLSLEMVQERSGKILQETPTRRHGLAPLEEMRKPQIGLQCSIWICIFSLDHSPIKPIRLAQS